MVSEPQITVQEVSISIGRVIKDKGGNLSIIVQPSEPSFTEAFVFRQYKSQLVNHVRLTIADSETLSVQDLKLVFGEYKEIPLVNWGFPRSIIFYVAVPKSRHKCGIIADVKLGEKGIEDGTVTSIIVR